MKRKVKSLVHENTELLTERNELQEIVDEMTEFMYRLGVAF